MSRGPSSWSPGQRQGFWGTAKQQRPLGILLQGKNTNGVRSKAGKEMGIMTGLQNFRGWRAVKSHLLILPMEWRFAQDDTASQGLPRTQVTRTERKGAGQGRGEE